jgi:hypothetical protein
VTLTVRTAHSSDNLAKIWAALGSTKLNREQVIVAVDADDDDALLGGVVALDAGHEVIFVGEFTLVPGIPHRRYVAKKLIDHLLIWADRRGATELLFTCVDGKFAAMALRLGATLIGTPTTLVLRLAGGMT